jgi:maleate cis-trans isomerase
MKNAKGEDNMEKMEKGMPNQRGWRGEVGMLVPGGYMLREYDEVAPEGVRFSKAILWITESTPEGLKEMHNQIEVEAKKLNMAFKSDLICLCCTSGSFIGGAGYDEEIIGRIEKASGSPGTTTVTCALELFKDMGVKKIVLTGPYTDLVFEEEVKFFAAHEIDALYVKGSGLGLVRIPDFYTYAMDQYSSYKLVKDAAKAAPKADCVFLSCMVSPLLGVADRLEKEVGKPVISSLSATLYGILKKLWIPDPVYHYGEALTRPRLSHQKSA